MSGEQPAALADPEDETHLFFDGTCGPCHRAVRLVLWVDRKARVRFAPIEGPTCGAGSSAHPPTCPAVRPDLQGRFDPLSLGSPDQGPSGRWSRNRTVSPP